MKMFFPIDYYVRYTLIVVHNKVCGNCWSINSLKIIFRFIEKNYCEQLVVGYYLFVWKESWKNYKCAPPKKNSECVPLAIKLKIIECDRVYIS